MVSNELKPRHASTARKVRKYGIFSGSYFPVFGLEKTLYLNTFHAVFVTYKIVKNEREEKQKSKISEQLFSFLNS